MNLHRIYLIALAIGIIIAAAAGKQYGDYERAAAARDATIATQNADIAQLKQKIQQDRDAAQQQIAELEKQSKQVVVEPAKAPIIIRDTIPLSEPLKQTAPITIDTLPDAPVAQITKQQEIELAQFGNSCKECSIARAQLQSQVDDQKQIIDRQKRELAADEETIKGGSILKRTLKLLKVAGCGAAGAELGALADRTKGAAIGSAAGSLGCSIF